MTLNVSHVNVLNHNSPVPNHNPNPNHEKITPYSITLTLSAMAQHAMKFF